MKQETKRIRLSVGDLVDCCREMTKESGVVVAFIRGGYFGADWNEAIEELEELAARLNKKLEERQQ